jgi:hypothetical protein
VLLRIATTAASVAAVLAVAVSGAGARPAGAGCPAAWKPGWQKLADRLHLGVYCPGWLPNPLDGRIGSDTYQFTQVDKRGGYLVSFLYYETGSTEVHVNFRRFPGAAMPRCRDLETTRQVACYSDAAGRLTANGIRATFYTVGRDADQWHLAYLWRHAGSTYVVSEHVAPPYGFQQVKTNLGRILRSLTLLQPET